MVDTAFESFATRAIRASTARRLGASNVTLMERAATAAATPRGSKPIVPVVPFSARPHMKHHFGFGSAPTKFRDSPFPSPPCWQGNGARHARDLRPTTPPRSVARPPERPSRKPTFDSPIRPHSCHFLSWPGSCFVVSPSQHHYRPAVDKRCDVRGDNSPMIRAVTAPGSRPDVPYFGITSRVSK